MKRSTSKIRSTEILFHVLSGITLIVAMSDPIEGTPYAALAAGFFLPQVLPSRAGCMATMRSRANDQTAARAGDDKAKAKTKTIASTRSFAKTLFKHLAKSHQPTVH